MTDLEKQIAEFKSDALGDAEWISPRHELGRKALKIIEPLQAENQELQSKLEEKWQTIESAPKDGLNILILSKNGDMWVGAKCDWKACKEWHYQVDVNNHDINEIPDPIFWMPLPKAPKINGESND